MKRTVTLIVLLFGICLSAHADVWRWVDAFGKAHYVDTMKPIYTWIDESGKVHYSDTPGHENAVSVELMWHSAGTLDSVAKSSDDVDSEDDYYAGETGEDRAERKKAEAYHCKRATEIYESYVKAPKLYRTDENGERVFLNEKEKAALIAETESKRDEYCD